MHVEELIEQELKKIFPESTYPVILDETTTFPAVTYRLLSLERVEKSPLILSPWYYNGFDRCSQSFEVAIRASSYKQLKDLSRTTYSRLHHAKDLYLILTAALDDYDSNLKVYQQTQNYLLNGSGGILGNSPRVNMYYDQFYKIRSYLEKNTEFFRVELFSSPRYRPLDSQLDMLMKLDKACLGNNLGDDRCPVACTISLHFQHSQAMIINMIAEIMKVLNEAGNFALGDGAGTVTNIKAEPYENNPNEYGYSNWKITFDITLYIIDSKGKEPPVPSQVYLGQSPKIGLTNEPEYKTVLKGDSQ